MTEIMGDPTITHAQVERFSFDVTLQDSADNESAPDYEVARRMTEAFGPQRQEVI